MYVKNYLTKLTLSTRQFPQAFKNVYEEVLFYFYYVVLENQVGLSKKHLDQYKAMLAANEEALSETNKVSVKLLLCIACSTEHCVFTHGKLYVVRLYFEIQCNVYFEFPSIIIEQNKRT